MPWMVGFRPILCAESRCGLHLFIAPLVVEIQAKTSKIHFHPKEEQDPTTIRKPLRVHLSYFSNCVKQVIERKPMNVGSRRENIPRKKVENFRACLYLFKMTISRVSRLLPNAAIRVGPPF